jgi:hypothetical protein
MREYQVGGGTARALVVEKGVVLLKRSPGLRPGTFSAVPTGLIAADDATQDWRPGLLSAVPAGLVPIRVEGWFIFSEEFEWIGLGLFIPLKPKSA